MRKLILRWVALAVFLTLVAFVFVRLGEWQLSRLDERREANQTMVANRERPVVDYRELLGTEPVADADQWRRVQLTGSYGREQYQVRYRNQAGQPGIEVVATFHTESGDELLVDRGFIPRQQGRPDIEKLPPTPDGTVTITGYVHGDEPGDANATTPHAFMVRRIDSLAISASLGRELLRGYVVLTPEGGAVESGQLQPVLPPEPTEGNHFSYALQWFAFSVIAIGGIAVLVRADLVDRRKAQARAERRAKMAAAADAGD